MPTINHKNLGDVQKHAYLLGTITQVYSKSDEVAEKYWDTADIMVGDYEYVWPNAPVFYHCYTDAKIRENGAIVDGAKGFAVGDSVVILCELITPSVGAQRQIGDVKVVGHKKGPVKCAYNYVFIRCSLAELEPLSLNDETANFEEQCIVFDVLTKNLAKILDPDNTDQYLSFPCPINKLKPFLASVDFLGVDLWDSFSQGDNEIQIAGVTPNWKSDVQGEDIRGSVNASDWWTTYNISGNPVQNLFEDMSLTLMTDDEGAATGTYSKTQAILDSTKKDIQKWDDRSSGFEQDSREYSVTGPPNLDIPHAIGTDGHLLKKATSIHIQAAFGEDEVWLCAVNSYDGMIVTYCDQMWKFIRMSSLPPAIPIPGLIENWENLSRDATIGSALPGGMASGMMIEDIGPALASDILLGGKGGENDIWSWGTLKRINEGAYHRTIHPAIINSLVLRTTAIPQNTEAEPTYLSALNFRQDNIKAWYRYDNWNSTFDYITNNFGVDPTWWFRSTAQQIGCEAVYVDTPIGSLWYNSPNWKGFVYHLYALQVGSVLMTARQDRALLQDFKESCKHSHNVVCQVYVVQRTSLTLWSIKADTFVKQMAGVDPYNSVPSENDEDPIAYAKMPDNTYKHFNELTPEEIESLISERIFLYTDSPDQTESLRLSRNEIEVMASADFYSDLYADFERRNPVDQERCPELEAEIASLIKSVTNQADSFFAPVYLDMEIL